MVFGYNQNNRTVLLRQLFFIIQRVSKIFSKKQCYNIDSIKLVNGDYIVTYFYRRERMILIKKASEILQSTELINNFNPHDAAIIGFCIYNPSKKQLEQFRRYFYN